MHYAKSNSAGNYLRNILDGVVGFFKPSKLELAVVRASNNGYVNSKLSDYNNRLLEGFKEIIIDPFENYTFAKKKNNKNTGDVGFNVEDDGRITVRKGSKTIVLDPKSVKYGDKDVEGYIKKKVPGLSKGDTNRIAKLLEPFVKKNTK